MIEVRHHLSRIYVGRDGVPEGAKVTAEVQQVPSHEDGLLEFDTVLTITPRPKRYVLPMEGTKLADGTIAYATLDHTGVWTIKGYAEKQSAVTFHATVTQSDIDTAPDWVEAITPVEVTDDEK